MFELLSLAVPMIFGFFITTRYDQFVSQMQKIPPQRKIQKIRRRIAAETGKDEYFLGKSDLVVTELFGVFLALIHQ